MSINDTYSLETGNLARVRTLRKTLEAEAPTILLHAGDFIGPSLLSREFKGQQMVSVFNLLDGVPGRVDERMFVTLGNHELDAKVEVLKARIQESEFAWVKSNIRFKDGIAAPNLIDGSLMECGGLKIGLYSITTELVKPDYVAEFLDPVETARLHTAGLKAQGAEVLIALTHQTVAQDKALIAALQEDRPDLVIGGHEHQFQNENVGKTMILKADSDAASAWVVHLSRNPRVGLIVEADREVLGAGWPEDTDVSAESQKWIDRFDEEWCRKAEMLKGCLQGVVGVSKTELVGEENLIRTQETNLGNWVADVAKAAFPEADAALINSGALRLNRNLAAGFIHRGEVESLFGFPMPLVLVEVSGAVLESMLRLSVSDLSGNGRFLQISSLSFWVLEGERTWLSLGYEPVRPDQFLKIVVPEFLVDPSRGQDGYTMLKPEMVKARGPDLKELVYSALKTAGEAGIEPRLQGRICLKSCGGAKP
jgi:2',3'-cyclic-nucleotide 2'-phosphodiesterase (5'-nucleotidase family)